MSDSHEGRAPGTSAGVSADDPSGLPSPRYGAGDGQQTEAVLLMSTTADRSEAERLGEALVEKRLAASGSVIPMIHSFFQGEGQLQRKHEALLLVKTSAARSAEAQAELKALHSYENPEILELRVSGGSAAYLDWLLAEVR